MSRFHRYSWGNILLIYASGPRRRTSLVFTPGLGCSAMSERARGGF
jgi:hypothetical protein